MTLLTGRDALDAVASNLPRLQYRHPFAMGGYENGSNRSFVWSPGDWALFPHSYHIRINVTGEPGIGNALDVETGDADPSHVPAWLQSQLHIEDPLLIYANRSNLAAVLDARKRVNGWQGRAWIWLATLDGTLETDRAMTQFSQLRDAQGAYADVSLILSTALVNRMADRIGKQTG